jgi:hypothetical protein
VLAYVGKDPWRQLKAPMVQVQRSKESLVYALFKESIKLEIEKRQRPCPRE